MENILLVLMIIIATLIIIVVLLQKSSSIGLGAYSGSNESLFGAKGPAGFLAKVTFALGFSFVVVAIWLGIVYNNLSDVSLLDNVNKNAAPKINTTIPKIDDAPKAPKIK